MSKVVSWNQIYIHKYCKGSAVRQQLGFKDLIHLSWANTKNPNSKVKLDCVSDIIILNGGTTKLGSITWCLNS